ncbi:MAG TPA: cyclase family protein [Dehalococcoidales bacterium]|nr:MAG: arylformamidase [Chloroflexi bacterium RBG_16_60_22]HJX13935.1 cyclase family protein [Dehalococcoidales bacterium]
MVKSAWIDISVPMPVRTPLAYWPDDPVPPKIERIMDVERGDRVTMSQININSHNGTHIDSPLHFIKGGSSIDRMPLETSVGPARVIEIKDEASVKVKELEPYKIKAGERILFKTRNSAKAYRTNQFVEEYVYISTEAARYLAEKKVRLVGLDYISIGKYGERENLTATHETLLRAGVYILEMINLDGVKPGDYELLCLPLRMENGDAGPARAILRPLR